MQTNKALLSLPRPFRNTAADAELFEQYDTRIIRRDRFCKGRERGNVRLTYYRYMVGQTDA